MIYFVLSWLLLGASFYFQGISIAFWCEVVTTIMFYGRNKGVTVKQSWIKGIEIGGFVITMAWRLAWHKCTLLMFFGVLITRFLFWKVVQAEAKAYTNFTEIYEDSERS